MKSSNELLTADPVASAPPGPAEVQATGPTVPTLTLLSSEEAFGICDLDGNCH